MHAASLTALALFVLGFGLVSKRTQTTPLTAPMVSVPFGVLAGPGAQTHQTVERFRRGARRIRE